MTRRDVVVVGAGPAGSVTALLLARAGARVLLLDRACFPRDKPCSEYLSPGSTRVLERLGAGVMAAIAAAAPARIAAMKIFAPSGISAEGRFERSSYALPRARFDLILREAAARAGVEVREGVKVDELIVERGAVAGVATQGVGNREPYRAAVIVGADGLRSVVARRLGLIRHAAPRRVAFTAHVADARDVRDAGEMHVGRRGYVGLGPIGDGVTTVALVVPAARASAGLGRRFFAELDTYPALAGRFDPARVVRPLLATGPFAQWSRRPAAPGVVLVGDAADFFDPFTGQGIYGALRGAELAAAFVLRALARGAVEAGGYARARRRELAAKWLLERLVALGVGWPALAERAVRRLARRPALADLLVRATGSAVPAGAALRPRALAGMLW